VDLGERPRAGHDDQFLYVIAVITLVSLVVSFLVRPPRPRIAEIQEVAPSPASS
jgi:hypothetical protein